MANTHGHPSTLSEAPERPSSDSNNHICNDIFTDNIINPLTKTHHSGHTAASVNNSVFPSKDLLQAALTEITQYTFEHGAQLLADMQLDGLAGITHQSNNGTIAATIDSDVWEHTIKTRISNSDSPPLSDVSQATQTSLLDTVSLAYTFQTQSLYQKLDITPETAIRWGSYAGKQTEDTHDIVLVVPHPMKELNSHTIIPERAIGLVGGIQRLTQDLPNDVPQTTVAHTYIYAYLVGYGMSRPEAIEEVASLYSTGVDTVQSHIDTAFSAINNAENIFNDDSTMQYYLSQPAFDSFITLLQE